MKYFFIIGLVLFGIWIFIPEEGFLNANLFTDASNSIQIKIDSLEEKSEDLKGKMTELQSQLEAARDAGSEKITDIETAIKETKEAFQSTKEAIDALQSL